MRVDSRLVSVSHEPLWSFVCVRGIRLVAQPTWYAQNQGSVRLSGRDSDRRREHDGGAVKHRWLLHDILCNSSWHGEVCVAGEGLYLLRIWIKLSTC